MNNNTSSNHFVGTLNYIAPELYNKKIPPYSQSSDIFALGCVFYEIYTLEKLYAGSKDEIKNKILDDSNEISFERNNLARNVQIESMILKMIYRNPINRISLEEIEDRIQKIKNDSHIISIPNPNSSTTYDFASHSQYPNLIVVFYLHDGYIKEKTFKNICEMNQEEFNAFWLNTFIDIMFPIVGQDDPSFPREDLIVLKNNQDKYLDNLQKLIRLVKKIPHYKDSKISNRVCIFLATLGLSYLEDEEDDSSNNNYNSRSISAIQLTSRKVPIFQRGGLHSSEWIFLDNVEIPNCPPQVHSLYYERPNEGNRLLSVNGKPSYTHPSGMTQGSEGLNYLFLEKIKYGDWWCNTQEGLKYVPVYQRKGKYSSKFVFIENAPIKGEYKDIIQDLYYARSNEGNELLSVNGKPSFCHLDGREVKGASKIPKEYLNKISQCGWWKK